MRRSIMEQVQRRREIKRKIHEAIRAERRKKLIESVIERKTTSRARRHGLASRLHENRLRRERILESLKERRRARIVEGARSRRARRLAEALRSRRRARLTEGFAGRRTISAPRSRVNETLDLENKLSRRSRIRHLLAKRNLRTKDIEFDDMDESRIERRKRIMEKIQALRGKKALTEKETRWCYRDDGTGDFDEETVQKKVDAGDAKWSDFMVKESRLRGKKALKEDEIDMEVQDETLPVETPDELGTEDGEELDFDLLLGESKEVKADIKQLNESKRFQSLINKYLSEGVLEEAKKEEKEDEDKEDEECKDGKCKGKKDDKECKDGECKKTVAKKSIKDKIKARKAAK